MTLFIHLFYYSFLTITFCRILNYSVTGKYKELAQSVIIGVRFMGNVRKQEMFETVIAFVQ